MSSDRPQDPAPSAFSLRARNIRKSFGGTEVLHGVDVDVLGGRVLALLGENGAGKSTLVRVIAGAHQPDAGTLEFGSPDGAAETATGLDPPAARRRGIRMIFQELSDAPDLTVAENISLGNWPRRRGLVDWRAVRQRARQVLDSMGVTLDLDAKVATLRVGERQIVEIARALSDDAGCLVLDEPTAALSAEECRRLFGFVRRLREQGVALVHITHRLDEVAELADDVVVLRDGAVSAAGPADRFDRTELVTAMVGRDIGAVTRPEPSTSVTGTPLLVFDKATAPPAFEELDLVVHAGEIVCLYGKVGSGTADVADAVFGRRRPTAGTVRVLDRPPADGPRQAIARGIGYLAADRQREGALLTRSVGENLAAPSWPRLSRFGLVDAARERRAFTRWSEQLGIRAPDGAGQSLAGLSGGNQQKVLLARWLERGSSLLALVEPTRGVDVGARSDIYAALRGMAADGAGILVATSDYEEVVQLADRALVMVRGRVTRELAGDLVTTEALTDAAGG
ncbi:sugar ABC transporter ATP-binding protein [Streptomyces triticagri]|uniref:Sugar ABC transporter ATP-binding protein n=1 Tax=Streptomyces triticagri TaxID=2293568 RepID=A0A372LZV7_9ACTN|nr:sugar ABC transporter ATP-binding protein [Streptomyces triticagri]RFU83900.1 sugar ABC transporter ATP-binding protein [Streptomyces triticagri]